MNQVIIYKQDNGTVAIIRPTEEAIELLGIDAIALKDVPAGKPYQIVDASTVPTDRTFRNAWMPDLSVDMPKAREMRKDKLRILRAPKLAALDIEYNRADEAGNTTLKAEIAAKKKALRDVTIDPAIAAAITPEQLKAVMPAILL